MRKDLEVKLMERFPAILKGLSGHKGIYFHCEDGWFVLLWMFLQEIEEFWQPVEFWTLKEKWGALRIYPAPDRHPFGDNPLPDPVWGMIDKVEHKSLGVCELCGEEGKLRWDYIWVRTLCDSCDFTYYHISPKREHPFPEEIKRQLFPLGYNKP